VSAKQGAPADRGDLRALYDETYYRDQLHREHWFHNNRAKQQLRWREVLRMVAPAPGETVLDLGCAVGEYTLRIAPLVARTIGVDFSDAAIRAATNRALGCGFDARFVASSVDALPLRSECVDKAMAIDLVEHVDDATLERMLAETWRVLRPGGTLSIYTPCATHYVERLKAREWVLSQIPGHIAVRAPADYEKLFRACPWQVALRYFSRSTFPLFGWLDRLLAPMPLVGPWFRFRYCVVLRKPE